MTFDESQMAADLKTLFETPPASREAAADGVSAAVADNHTDYSPTIQAWQTPSLINSWVNFGGSHSTAGYYKDPHGRVHLRGMIKNGSGVPTVAFVLPSGYRPSALELHSTISNSAVGRVNIDTNGDVSVESPSSTVWVSLNGISFRAA